jgi:hypothetical protein
LKKKAKNMFQREVNEQHGQHGKVNARKEMEITLQKLRTLRDRISELRAQCEELKRLGSRSTSSGLLCNQCGESIEPGQEILVKNSDGTERKQYHKECFKLLWV